MHNDNIEFNIFKLELHLLQEHGVLPNKSSCTHCHRDLTDLKQKGDYLYYYCGQCKMSRSLKNGTFLNHSQLSYRSVIFLVYFLTSIPTLTYDQSKNTLIPSLSLYLLLNCLVRTEIRVPMLDGDGFQDDTSLSGNTIRCELISLFEI